MQKLHTHKTRFALVTVLLFLTMILIGCFVGYTGPEGEILEQYLSPEELKTLTENPNDDIWIIDVRPHDKYVNAHIPTARSYPSSGVEGRLDELPKSQYLIVYCETGGRAQAVIRTLEDYGYTRFINWGGFSRWEYETESGE